MLIKLSTIMAGPAGTRQPGEIVEVGDKQGQELIDGGFAELAKQKTAAEIEAIQENPAPDQDYTAIGKGALREMCTDRNLDLQDGATKADMIELLELDDQTK